MGRPRETVAALAVVLASLAACGGATAPEPTADELPCPVSGPPPSAEVRARTVDEGIEGTYVVEVPGSGDVVGDDCPDYPSFPPADGPIAGSLATCGFYDVPVQPSRAVHSLRNGAVWIAYDPDLDPRSLAVVRRTATRASHVLASPVPGLPAPIVLSAWKRQIQLPGVEDPRFDEWVTAYLFTPDRPVVYTTCRDGVGDPVGRFGEPEGR